MSDWAAEELELTMRYFVAGICLLHGHHTGRMAEIPDRPGVRSAPSGGEGWPTLLRWAEKITWPLAAYTYAHAEQLRRYREIVAAETEKYEEHLRQWREQLAGQVPGPPPGETN